MPTIQISAHIRKHCPDIRLGIIHSKVKVHESTKELLNYINEVITELRETLMIGDVSQLPTIRETKSAYRLFGKDPSRYRPSAESLLRRVLNKKDLYLINNAIDSLNLISLKYGFSIGGYDENKIDGMVFMDLGKKNEDYNGIGRGTLNIHDLPILRDQKGPFGSPTSDSMRTMITAETKDYARIHFQSWNHPGQSNT